MHTMVPCPKNHGSITVKLPITCCPKTELPCTFIITNRVLVPIHFITPTIHYILLRLHSSILTNCLTVIMFILSPSVQQLSCLLTSHPTYSHFKHSRLQALLTIWCHSPVSRVDVQCPVSCFEAWRRGFTYSRCGVALYCDIILFYILFYIDLH